MNIKKAELTTGGQFTPEIAVVTRLLLSSSKKNSTPTGSEMTNTEGSASSSEEELVISAVFADKLLHGSHKRTWFHIIFGFLRHNQADRIELRSFCKLFRDLLRPPSQIWTQFPHSVHTTWRSLIDAVNASWRKDAKKAPTLIVVRKPKTRYVHPNVGRRLCYWMHNQRRRFLCVLPPRGIHSINETFFSFIH